MDRNRVISKYVFTAIALLLVTVFSLRNFSFLLLTEEGANVNTGCLEERIQERSVDSWMNFLISFIDTEKKGVEEESDLEIDDKNHAPPIHFYPSYLKNSAFVFQSILKAHLQENSFLVADIKAKSAVGVYLFNLALII